MRVLCQLVELHMRRVSDIDGGFPGQRLRAIQISALGHLRAHS
jgi:hypothetical protein